MPDEERAIFRTRDGPVRARVVRNPNPHIEVSESVLHRRDGNKTPAQGDKFGICVDSRGRHRSVPARDERSTYREVSHEVVGERVVRLRDGSRERRVILRKEAE